MRVCKKAGQKSLLQLYIWHFIGHDVSVTFAFSDISWSNGQNALPPTKLSRHISIDRVDLH